MNKILIAATAAAVIGGSAIAYTAFAQSGFGHGRWGMNSADMSAFADARIAALKAGLALSPEQEKLWPPVETVLRDMAKKRIELRERFRAERESGTPPTDPIARLRRGADVLTERGTQMKRLADASQPLYDKLDDAQKRRLQLMMQHGRHARFMHERGGWRRGEMGEQGRRWGWHHDEGRRGMRWDRDDRGRLDGERERL